MTCRRVVSCHSDTCNHANGRQHAHDLTVTRTLIHPQPQPHPHPHPHQAGDWDTNNADDAIAAAAVPDVGAKKKKKAVPKKARVAKVAKKEEPAATESGSNGQGDGSSTTTPPPPSAASAAREAANAALPCGHYAECSPGPVTTALFFNCAITYLLFTSGKPILPSYVEVALKAAPVAALLGWTLQDEQIKVRLLLRRVSGATQSRPTPTQTQTSPTKPTKQRREENERERGAEGGRAKAK